MKKTTEEKIEAIRIKLKAIDDRILKLQRRYDSLYRTMRKYQKKGTNMVG